MHVSCCLEGEKRSCRPSAWAWVSSPQAVLGAAATGREGTTQQPEGWASSSLFRWSGCMEVGVGTGGPPNAELLCFVS